MLRPLTSRGPSDLLSSTSLIDDISLSSSTSLVSLPSSSLSTSLKSIKTVEKIEELEELTEEQRLRYMLGEKNTTTTNIFLREDYCGACGIQHPNYRLLDTYFLCESCLNCLRDHSHLRNRYKGIPQVVPLEICFATYGDVTDCRLAYDVTTEVQALVDDFLQKDRLIIRETQKLHKIFSCGDPVPGKQKQLRIRYRIANNHGFLCLDIMENNQVPGPVILMCPPERSITILRGSYGHPKGRTSTGRMSYDVKENLQGLVDLNYGSYLYISSMFPLFRQFGDPCVGYVKDLQVEFDISGRYGQIAVGELRGRLKKNISIRTSPCVSPLIYVAYASYGLTENGIKERLNEVNKNLHLISLYVQKRKIDLPLRPQDRQLIRKEDAFKLEKAELLAATPASFEVTSKVQRMIEMQGGLELVLDKKDFDPNFTFGNPKPGKKLLEISVKCYGHDSEMRTDSKEVTTKGYLRNYILGKGHRFLIPVLDAEDGKGVMQQSIEFRTNNVLPLMNIDKAIYGHPHDNQKTFDVTSTVQNLVKGRLLQLTREMDLTQLFGDPCFGVNKVLKIFYQTRGFTGAVRVREKGGTLVAAVELGFPPEIPEDDC